ncbi:hypothetical protein NOVOSPHI9U_260253 [Novosphingobium sp. 9U]|nr:hypothetical protein NOVOSPHI9U_260253 [Novosphingobium sp. 9U]
MGGVLKVCDETVLLGLQNSLYCRCVCALMPNLARHFFTGHPSGRGNLTRSKPRGERILSPEWG